MRRIYCRVRFSTRHYNFFCNFVLRRGVHLAPRWPPKPRPLRKSVKSVTSVKSPVRVPGAHLLDSREAALSTFGRTVPQFP